jgi:hypothetical protein
MKHELEFDLTPRISDHCILPHVLRKLEHPSARQHLDHRKHCDTNRSQQVACTALNFSSQACKLGRRRRSSGPTNTATSTTRSIPAHSSSSQERRTSPITERPSRSIRTVVRAIIVSRDWCANNICNRRHAEIQAVGCTESSVVAPGIPCWKCKVVRLREEIEGECVWDVVQRGHGAAWKSCISFCSVAGR